MNIEREIEAARMRVFFKIDVAATKQKLWLKAAGESMNRSIGQKWRHAKGKK